MSKSSLERFLARDRVVISLVLVALTVVSWAQMLPEEGSASGGARIMACCGARFGVAFTMWVVMMAGMMIPSVAPMVLTHASIMRRRVSRGAPFASSGLFLAGYLVAWSGFSFVAALAQWGLYHTGLLDGRSLAIGPWAGAAVLVAAGFYQRSTAKDACLAQCRAPLGYFMTEWRDGRRGAVMMGLRHGVFCIGCCWLLMAVLFSVGIMNLLWGAVITAFVIAEKIAPWPRAVVRIGSAACFLGATLLVGFTLFER